MHCSAHNICILLPRTDHPTPTCFASLLGDTCSDNATKRAKRDDVYKRLAYTSHHDCLLLTGHCSLDFGMYHTSVVLECLACVIPYHHISAHLHCHHAYHITTNMKIEEELHRQDQGEQAQVARIKQKRSKNTDHVIAPQKGQARYQSSQKTKRQGSNKCDQEHASAPYNTQETHNSLNMKIELLNKTGTSSGTLSVLECLVHVKHQCSLAFPPCISHQHPHEN
jgi:hypothetical protein